MTDGSLDAKKMRDREFVNRFCAFRILDLAEYLGDMDEFLASCLRKMNKMTDDGLSSLSGEFHRGLANNFILFDRHAFRKHVPGQDRRSTLNASFWDVMSTGLSRYTEERVRACAEPLRTSIYQLLDDEEFNNLHLLRPERSRKYGTVPGDQAEIRGDIRHGTLHFQDEGRGVPGDQAEVRGETGCSGGFDLRHFKCFTLLKLPLCPLTLLSAPMRRKSSVLQALVLLHQTMRSTSGSSRLMLNGSAVRLGTVADVIDQMHGAPLRSNSAVGR